MEEAERRVLEDELTKMTAILKHQHETIKQKSNQKEQLANCEQDMVIPFHHHEGISLNILIKNTL